MLVQLGLCVDDAVFLSGWRIQLRVNIWITHFDDDFAEKFNAQVTDI